MGTIHRGHRAPPPGDVTVRDVAAAAGVSIGTVSHVVSGRRRVADATRQRVETAIRSLQYRPNRLARALLERRTQTIGMLIPDVGNPFFGELARAVERTARVAGYCVVFGNSENDQDAEARYLVEFVERRVDGLVVVAAAGDSWADRLPSDLAVVALDRFPAGWPYDAVVVDNRLGMELAVAHLAELGHQSIGFLGGDVRLTTGSERASGFRAAVARRGLRPAWRGSGSFSLESGQRQTERLLRLEPSKRPSAIVAANDLIALGALRACREGGVAVPAELSVIGFDDIPFAGLAFPPLTTVRQPIDHLGAVAAELLLERMRAERTEAQARVVTVRPDLVVRGSTAARRVGDGA
jgi:LacI family transcriptional regulator